MATPKHLQRAAPQYENFTLDGDQLAPAAALSHRSTSRTTRPSRPKPYVAPINRSAMDDVKPWFFLLVAAAFFILSLISTVSQVDVILRVGGIELGRWEAIGAGLLVAAIITAGELMTGESLVYFCFLIPDVVLTVWWMWPALLRWSVALGAGTLGAALAGIAVGILTAWIPERVILGRRRRWGREGEL